MSWQHARALLDVGLKPTTKLVGLALALRAGTDGRAWPSVARLCDDTGLGDTAVRQAIQTLAAAGILNVEHRPGQSLIVTVTASPGDGVARPLVTRPHHLAPKSASPGDGRRSKEVTKKRAAPGSTASGRPPQEDKGNVNGPAPGETWGEYRERGGR